jgi:SAM-dependent methyltransferase
MSSRNTSFADAAQAAMTDAAAGAMLNAAVEQFRRGQGGEAEANCRRIIELYPDFANAHSLLGSVLLAGRRPLDAIESFKRAISLQPDNPIPYDQLARAYMAIGRAELAIEPAAQVALGAESPERKLFFAHCVAQVRFKADDGRFRRVILRALAEGWARPRELTAVCLSLLRLNPSIAACAARAIAAWPRRLDGAELFGPSGFGAVTQDDLLRCLLECDPIPDIAIERLLTNLRRVILFSAAADATMQGVDDNSLLGFCCALARQCYINQYVFSLDEAEAETAQRLRGLLEDALAGGEKCAPLLLAVVGSYFPLHSLRQPELLLERPWPASVEAVLTQQVKEPALEAKIAEAIPVLGAPAGAVAEAVRQQYEESPYPRWVRIAFPGTGVMESGAPTPDKMPDVLIAGCGTGLSTVEFSLHSPRARLLAVDLSRASLGYAKRMAQKFGLGHIEFAQADIMTLRDLDRSFDLIDASGVLHHLDDLFAGWRVLVDLLRPGGMMQIGLYSEQARRNVVAVYQLIAERGYRPTPEDIRRCRDDIATAHDPLLSSILCWEDFYATNECRDLLFHVQERRVTLRDVKTFLAENGLEFLGFLTDPATQARFAQRFPDPAAMLDLDRWHDFETDAPETFAAMYQFLVRKPAAP